MFTLIISLLTVLFSNNFGAATVFNAAADSVLVTPKLTPVRLQDKMLNRIYSEKKLGAFVEDGQTIFRLFAPQAVKVTLCIFTKPGDTKAEELLLTKDDDGVWDIALWGEKRGIYYGFKVWHINEDTANGNKPVCVDPYARAVTTFNTYLSPRLGLLADETYDWEGDKWIQRDWRDAIIYEMHVRDMTAHPTAKAKKPGTYMGLTEKGITGGLDYIKALGVNTVELLPAMEFANIELPYKKDSLLGRINTWNPYERNHWGYMTSSFFAPAAYYSEDWKTLQWNTWQGKEGKQVNAFKDMVKSFHREGIAVIMDVVYNHLSEYEMGNLKEIDKEYYFRRTPEGIYTAVSGCGNDLKTERKMVRRLIVESILYWMKEYHVDGFRFDLGKMIDWRTIEEIIREARKINPDVIFVCEPWGGGYDPTGFSVRDWGAWNDQIRNGVKGENPVNGLGWIFGKWFGNNSVQRIQSYVNGTLVRDLNGLFTKKAHSVNYLESHDGYTLGDFIRIGTREVDPAKPVKNVDALVKLTPLQARLNKLAAALLFSSQGMLMIQAGQEFARTKVIPANVAEPDTHKGHIDHNTYDKDNEVNYINYKHAGLNKDLVNYYKGLTRLRNTYDAFRRAKYENVQFYTFEEDFLLGYSIKHEGQRFICLFNPLPHKNHTFDLPEGKWDVLVNKEIAGIKSLAVVNSKVTLEPQTCMILKLK
ncbi:MAG: pullulanase [Ignavibacteriales bacterium]|nr:pullulanase [Ignavibacteriales bacterium]